MAQFFTRAGKEFSGRVFHDDKRHPRHTVVRPCGRCGGAGGSEKWRHSGFTCFDCGGDGKGRTVEERLYTAEELAKLNARVAKFHATRQAKVDAKIAAAKVEAEARSEAFRVEFADILPWLEVVGMEPDRYGEGRMVPRDGFLGDMLQQAQNAAFFTEKQAEALRAAKVKSEAREAAKATSQHVGQPKQRLTFTVTVEHVTYFDRPKFNASWLKETVYVVIMRDETGNVLVSKGTSFFAEKGDKLTFKATVKEHGERNGEKQTIVQRIVVTERPAEQEEAA